MAGKGASSNIRVENVKETITALAAFEPEIHKRLNVQIRKAMGRIKTRAQGKYPAGAWQVQLNKKRILGSIRTTPGSSLDATRWGEAAPGVRAAIFEFAGSRSAGATPQARGLIKSLNARYGQPGRFLWAAWDEQGNAVLEEIRASVKSAERELQSRLDSRGESY